MREENSMVNEQIMKAYLDVEQAMQQYNIVLNEYLASLHTDESVNATKIERMTAGTKAMQDSSGIYLSYAKFVAYGMPESEDLLEEEDLQT